MTSKLHPRRPSQRRDRRDEFQAELDGLGLTLFQLNSPFADGVQRLSVLVTAIAVMAAAG